MSRVVIIGGSGHVGTYLVPRLVEAGFEVCNVTRGQRQPYSPHGAWKTVQTVVIDREAEEKAGTFGRAIRNLKADIVIDMICFSPESARQMVEALDGHIGHFLHCGTIWVHGPSVAVPTTEMQPRRPFGDYGIRKAAIEAYLIGRGAAQRLPGDRPPSRPYRRRGLEPAEPGRPFRPEGLLHAGARRGTGAAQSRLETVHHVHADDVAQGFMKAIANWSTSVGEAFHVVSPAAVTLQRLCRGGRRLVRPRPEACLSALGGMEGGPHGGRGGGDLGPHRPQPELLHRQGPPAARLSSRATPPSRRCANRSSGWCSTAS